MNADLLVSPLGATVLLIATGTVVAVLRAVRLRKRQKRRVVELPNSHYQAPAVRQAETRHRWQGIDVSLLHEINRGEVVRLLERVEALGAESLRPAERTFLDRMVEIAGPGDSAAPA